MGTISMLQAQALKRCGISMGGNPAVGARSLKLRGVPIDELVRLIPLDRIVLDKTGLKGRFDIELEPPCLRLPSRLHRSAWTGTIRRSARAGCHG